MEKQDDRKAPALECAAGSLIGEYHTQRRRGDEIPRDAFSSCVAFRLLFGYINHKRRHWRKVMEGLKLFVSPMLGSVDSVFAEIGIEISYMSGEDAFGVSHQIPMNTPWNWIDINFTVESLVVTSQFYLAENDNPSEFAYVWEIGMKKLLLNTTSLVFPGIVIIPTFLYESVID